MNATRATLLLLTVSLLPASARADDLATMIRNRDVPALTMTLKHRDGRIRSEAAVALARIAVEFDDADLFTPLAPHMLDATIRDPYATVREYAGRAFRHAVKHVEQPAVLKGSVSRLVDALEAGEVDDKRRLYAAVALWELVPRVENEALLVESTPRLLAATIDDPHERVREYAGRALRSTLERVRDADTLSSATIALAAALGHEDVRRRHYAAVTLSGLVSRVERPATLRTVAGRVRTGARDEDATVKEYAGRALRHIEKQLDARSEP